MITAKRTITVPLDADTDARLKEHLGSTMRQIREAEAAFDVAKTIHKEAMKALEPRRDNICDQLVNGEQRQVEVHIEEDARRPGTVLETRVDTGETIERAGTLEELDKLRQGELPLERPVAAEAATEVGESESEPDVETDEGKMLPAHEPEDLALEAQKASLDEESAAPSGTLPVGALRTFFPSEHQRACPDSIPEVNTLVGYRSLRCKEANCGAIVEVGDYRYDKAVAQYHAKYATKAAESLAEGEEIAMAEAAGVLVDPPGGEIADPPPKRKRRAKPDEAPEIT